MINFYVVCIRAGILTIDDVPAVLIEKVQDGLVSS